MKSVSLHSQYKETKQVGIQATYWSSIDEGNDRMPRFDQGSREDRVA